MITVSIIAILAGIAYPGYVYHMNKMRKADAQAALVELGARLQEYYVDQSPPTYTGAALGAGGVYTNRSPATGPVVYYNLNITTQDARSFTLQAAPVAGTPVATDNTYVLNSNGRKQHIIHGEATTTNGWP